MKKIEKKLILSLIIALFVLIFSSFYYINIALGVGRVINYSGIVRGATQRLVKLTVVDEKNQHIQNNLDEIIFALENGSSSLNLKKLNYPVYNKKVNQVKTSFEELKVTIDEFQTGDDPTELIEQSEKYFVLTDQMVSSAEKYSDIITRKLILIERLILGIICIIILFLLKRAYESIKLYKENKELASKAYLDLHTGLPNKSRCEEIINDGFQITSPTAVAVFDLNDLKKVNDSLGHIAGDGIIKNFANILRVITPEKHFLGRYGGDEFIGVFYDVSKEEVEEILQNIREETGRYNDISNNTHLSYGCGYSISTDFDEVTLKVLLQKADANMYIDKKRVKEMEKRDREKKSEE